MAASPKVARRRGELVVSDATAIKPYDVSPSMKSGRILTPAVQEQVVTAIAGGNHYHTAAAAAGIHRRTLNKWMMRGEREASGPFRDFYEAVKAADVHAERRAVASWTEQVPLDWRAARDFLARRYPDRWGERHVLAGEPGAPVEVTFIPWAPRVPQDAEEAEARSR